MRVVCTTIINSEDGEAMNGPPIDTSQLYSASFQAVFTDLTAAGTFKLQASNDPTGQDRRVFQPTNWTDIPNATITITAGVGPILPLPSMTYSFIRAVWTPSDEPESGGAILNMNAVGV